MITGEEIRTRGHSDHILSSNAEKFYENYWQDAPEISETTRRRNRAILDRFLPDRPKGKTILEIGVGGEGGLVYSLKKENQVLGIDVSPSAKRNSERLGVKVDIINVDTQGIPFAEETFDVIFAFEVFEHFANPQFALEEIRRVLKENGLFLLSIPNPFIHHWPRLFYPTLFEEKAFREFLMVNDFQIKSKTDLGQNLYYFLDFDQAAKAFMWCWECKKQTTDPEVAFDHGLYFWEQKNGWGIRLCPIEAADLFRKSLEWGGEKNIKARLFLILALRYRYVYQETEEFRKHLKWFRDRSQEAELPLKIKSLFALSVIILEMNQWGLGVFDSITIRNVFRELLQLPQSSHYKEIWSGIKSGTVDYKKIVSCLV
ncbi:MAG: class I SAM-dependent methyltransferase [Thermodesulfobacteriota bacterium]